MLDGLNVAKWQSGDVATEKCAPCPLSTKSNTRGSKITDSSLEDYFSSKFIKFVLKIAIKREQRHARMNSVERERFR